MKWLVLLTVCSIVVVSTSGCAGIPVAAVAGATAATQAPAWIGIAQEVVTGVKVMTEAEQLACELQAAANVKTPSDSTTSIAAGYFCKGY